MQDREQVFLYMKEEIQRLAKVKIDSLSAETNKIEEQAYQQIKEEAMNDANKELDKELASIASKSSLEAASNSEEYTKKLVAKRDTYTEDIFNQAKDKLVDFVASKDYLSYMIKGLAEVSNKYQMNDVIMYLRNEDLKLKDELVKAYNLQVKVEISNKIKIGGFIIENNKTSIVIDESLDFALENQKDWFLKTSGLMIK